MSTSTYKIQEPTEIFRQTNLEHVNNLWDFEKPKSTAFIRKGKHRSYLTNSRFTSPILKIEIKGEIIELPSKLQHVFSAIESSKYILELSESWDDEGAIKPPKHVWEKGVSFLTDYSISAYNNYRVIIEAPEINPGRDGSIDLVWRTANTRLLVNIKNNDDCTAVYYGDQYQNKNGVKGVIANTEEIEEFLLVWMKKLKA